MHIFRIQQVLLCFLGLMLCRRGCLMSSLTRILKSQFHGYICCQWGGQWMFSHLHLCRLLSISGVLGSLALQQGSEVLIPKVCVPTWFQPVGFVCCPFSSSGSCWRAGLSAAFPLLNNSGLSLRTPSLEKSKCNFQVGILCLCSSVMQQHLH